MAELDEFTPVGVMAGKWNCGEHECLGQGAKFSLESSFETAIVLFQILSLIQVDEISGRFLQSHMFGTRFPKERTPEVIDVKPETFCFFPCAQLAKQDPTHSEASVESFFEE